MSNTNWTLPETHLVAELAVGLARRLFSILDGQDHIIYPEPGYVWHMATSDFEDGCKVLWHLDVAVAAYAPGQGRRDLTVRDRTEKGSPPYFKFSSAAEIRAKILNDPLTAAPPLDEVLSAYLGVMCNYGRSDTALSSDREPFIPPRQYKREIDALERLGYVERRGDAVIWTDRITNAMHARLLWNNDGQLIDIEASLRLIIATKALSQISDESRRLLEEKARHFSKAEFAHLVRDQFERLLFNADGRAKSQTETAALLEALYLTLAEKR